MTRLYCVADIHGRGERFRIVEAALNRYRPDALVLAGDVLGVRSARIRETYFSRLGLPVFCVLGNADHPMAHRHVPPGSRMRILKDERIRFRDVGIVGISGTLPLPFHSRIGFRETDRVNRLMKQVDRNSLLICHPPPYGICDKVMGRISAGSKAIARIVRHCQPQAVICGHIHEGAGLGRIGSTQILNSAMNAACHGWIVDLLQDRTIRVSAVSIES